MSYRWVKIRSYHMIRDDEGVTLCGRPYSTPPVSEPDGNDRTCERCFQIRESDA